MALADGAMYFLPDVMESKTSPRDGLTVPVFNPD